jgi:cytochrome c peroxidase
MPRPSRLALACSWAVLAAACGGSGGGGGGGSTDPDVQRLRAELENRGIRPLPAPPRVSDELFELGQALFFDKILSGGEDVSCATCHAPDLYTGDARTLPNGVGGIGLGPNRGGGSIVARHAPPLFALHLKRALFWDGRVEEVGGFVRVPPDVVLLDEMRAAFVPGLEVIATQALLPPFARAEMRGFPGQNDLADKGEDYGAVWAALLERLLDLPGYVALLRAAYPRVALVDLDFGHAANAIAAFEVRAFSRTDSPFERFVRGDDAALSTRQVKGALEFFGRARCAECHSGALFSDQQHHNVGLPQLGPGVGGDCAACVDVIAGSDIGREMVSGCEEDRYRFRTPSLLNVELTGPYGHAGQFAHLHDVVEHYRDAALSLRQYDIGSNVFDPDLVTTLASNSEDVLARIDPRLAVPSDFDVDAVVEFLFALTADDVFTLSEVAPASVPSGLPIF